jgi:F0F1-type ATP synthase assembly protein I
MLRFTSLFLIASFTAGTAVASTTDTVAASVSSRPANREIQFYPSISDLLLAETHKNVNVDATPSDTSYTLVIAANTLGGALVGLLIGGAIYLVQDPDHRHAVNLAWWTGGGALLGVGAGVVQVIVRANRDSDAVSQRELMLPEGTRRVFGWTFGF